MNMEIFIIIRVIKDYNILNGIVPEPFVLRCVELSFNSFNLSPVRQPYSSNRIEM